MKNAQLKQSKNYSMFIPNDLNRDVDNTQKLEKSMRENGFDEGLPVRCIRDGGKLKITHGNHRFHVARKLGLGVWYIVAENNDLPLFDSEASTNAWSPFDYTKARARAGDIGAEQVLQYHESTGIPLQATLSLIGGESAGSNNMLRKIKDGSFKAKPTKHTEDVTLIVTTLKKLGVEFATKSPFVNAVSKCLRVPKFEVDKFLHKAITHKGAMERQRDLNGYLDMIEFIYNRQSHDRLPIKFMANDIGKKRKISFGKS